MCIKAARFLSGLQNIKVEPTCTNLSAQATYLQKGRHSAAPLPAELTFCVSLTWVGRGCQPELYAINVVLCVYADLF